DIVAVLIAMVIEIEAIGIITAIDMIIEADTTKTDNENAVSYLIIKGMMRSRSFCSASKN
ncbi:MAG: hypothetical protein U1E02_21775, partial [Hydrogenophaga sp.]|nr:hypothetical protein [Hydrogenophaga sp.]